MSEFDCSSNPSSDSLVLKITERFMDTTNSIDNIIYIFFDINEDRYHLRCKRFDIVQDCLPYSFCCDNPHDLFDFINFIIPPGTQVMYDFITYKSMALSSNDVTYSYLEENYDYKNEIVGYYPKKIKRRRLLNILRMLRNIYNDY